MRYTKLFLFAALSALTLSCNKEMESNQPAANGINEITASFADSQTKTVLGSDGNSVLWSPNDEISVFYGTSGMKFTSINTQPDDMTIFASSQALVFGGSESSTSRYLWAVYPYSSDNASDKSSVTLTVPATQTAVEGSFGRGAYPSVGRSKDTNIAFYNVCGGVCFSVTASGVKRVLFSGRNNEKLAGRVQVSFDGEGKPGVVSVLAGEEEIRIDAPDGEEFTPGARYYISILPSALLKGFRMVFYTDSKHATLERTSSVEVKRSVFGLLKNADSGLVYEDGGLAKGRVFTASLSSGTKTSIESGTGILSWDEGQTIFLSDGDSTDTPVIDKQTEQTCTVTTTKMNKPTVLGGIPSEYFSLGSSVCCTIPTVQDGTFNGACVMLAKTDLSNSLEFATEISILKITISEEVDSVRLSGADGKAVAGTCIVNSNGAPYLEAPSAKISSSIIVKPSSKSSVFYFGILPCVTKINIDIYKDGCVAHKSTSKDVTFNKGYIISMNIGSGLFYYVDMGLSVKWATCNVGASKPEDYGRYFAWGDVEGQTWDGSSWSGGGFSTYPKYELDANKNLKPEYDAAHVLLGGSWRMPTKSELDELINNCTSTWTNIGGVNGRLFTSKKEGYTDKSIFLPAAGCGLSGGLYYAGSYGGYWSGTFNIDSTAWLLIFGSGGVSTNLDYRDYGQSVRPVSE